MPTRTAIVTGHTHGLGAALAQALLDRGWAVLGLSRSLRDDWPAPARPAETGQVAAAASAPDAMRAQVRLDLSDAPSLIAWLGSGALRDFCHGSRQSLLLNNAGQLAPIGPPGAQPPADIARAVALNVTAPLLLSQGFVQATADVPDRRIVHVSSGAGRSAYPGWSIYCATKAALDHHARATALDRIPGLRIASVAPGVIDTAMQAQIRATPTERFPLRERFEQMKRQGQLTSPRDAAERLVAHALSEDFGAEAVVDVRGR